MRMNRQNSLTAEQIVNEYSLEDLEKIFRDFGEEKLAGPIARSICEVRKTQSIRTTIELAELARKVYRDRGNADSKIHPATRIFQAIRIEVNGELENLELFLPQAIELLKSGGRLGVITFHSLEDRIVKNYFSLESKDCICPPQFPVCRCLHEKRVKKITTKPIVASEEETRENPRSRSAKLRIIEKL
jgi:16S rRNA (cytosine1402-N4)-methyltransferase